VHINNLFHLFLEKGGPEGPDFRPEKPGGPSKGPSATPKDVWEGFPELSRGSELGFEVLPTFVYS
jgi:hypothetical protein